MLADTISKDYLSTKGVESFYCVDYPEIVAAKRLHYVEAPKELLSQLPRRAMCSITKSTWDDPSLNSFAYPTAKGLCLLAAYYWNKYHISILVSDGPEGLIPLLEGKATPDIPIWGVVATQDGAIGHVTPILCARQPDGSIQTIQLDSIGEPITAYHEACDSLIAEKAKISFTWVLGKRQADMKSCKTDALVILKDALRDLQSKGITDLESYLKPYLMRDHCITLPAFWGRTVQYSSALLKPDLSSKVLTKKGESLSEFQARHKAATHLETTYHFQFSNWDGSEELSPIELSHTTEDSPNRFLNQKGKQHLQLVKSLVSELSLPGSLQDSYNILLEWYNGKRLT